MQHICHNDAELYQQVLDTAKGYTVSVTVANLAAMEYIKEMEFLVFFHHPCGSDMRGEASAPPPNSPNLELSLFYFTHLLHLFYI